MNKNEIELWLIDMGIKNYFIQENLEINVAGQVDLCNKGLLEIPVQFSRVDGVFDCSDNALVSLKGSPKWVGEDFLCSNNQLTSLQGAPLEVKGNFQAYKNPFETVEFLPIVGQVVCFSKIKELNGLNGFYNRLKLIEIDYAYFKELLQPLELEKRLQQQLVEKIYLSKPIKV